MNIICFHKPDEENGYLSNWYPADFTMDGIRYSSMEQYMMYQKALCFKDKTVAEQILQTDDVYQIKELGRMVSNYNDSYWSGVRQMIVFEGLKEKFMQNEGLRTKLLDTKDAVLAECAVRDHIWGIGWSMKDPERLDMDQWRGQNLLGYALMMVRDLL